MGYEEFLIENYSEFGNNLDEIIKNMGISDLIESKRLYGIDVDMKKIALMNKKNND